MKKIVRRTASAVLAAVFLLSLSSCGRGGPLDSALLYVGIDAHDYAGESVTEIIDPHSDFALSLSDTVHMLTLDSPDMTVFSDAKKLPDLYTDQLLTYLLNSRFSKYSGNPDLLEKVEQEYSGFYATTVIPAEDFDSLLRVSFGASANVSHPDGKIFRYLSKVNAYITETQPLKNTVTTEIVSCEATEYTYRLTFRNHVGDMVSGDYLAIFVKREEGDPYLKSLTKATS